MKEKKDGIPDRFPNMSAIIRTSTEVISHDYNNSSNFYVKKFTTETYLEREELKSIQKSIAILQQILNKMFILLEKIRATIS